MLGKKVKTYTKLAGRNDETLHQINMGKGMETQLNQIWRPRRRNLILAITAVAGFLMAAGVPQYPANGLKAGQKADEDR